MTLAFILIAVLLLAGVALRVLIPIFQKLYIPASALAGGLGLILFQISEWKKVGSLNEIAETLREWPGWLIAVVFAGMLLERKPPPWSESLSRVGRQGLMVWVIVLGQTSVGLLVTWLLIHPFYDLPNSTGMLIETGFAGGHGTAAAMGEVYEQPGVALDDGLDLGILMATCGLLYGLVSGVVWINLAVRLGWVETSQSLACSTEPKAKSQPAIGYAKISGETIDPLLLQVIWLSLAFATGLALQSSVTFLGSAVETTFSFESNQAAASGQSKANQLSLSGVLSSFPLFIYTLFGGWLVRWTLRLFKAEELIDRETINRLTSTAMDILVVSAIATINVTAVAALLVPFLLLFIGGCLWCGFCLLYLARRMLPEQHWFQLGLINYGMSTGTTATGFVLLRLVDPELESGAAEDYAMAAPLSSPFIGGGMITVGLPLLVLERVPIAISTVALSATVIALITLGWRWNQASRTR